MRIILDGGLGRELKRVGAPFKQPEWSALALMEAPERVVEVHRSFIDAGAQIITTNNYAVVPFHIGAKRFEEQGDALTALAGELAREAASGAVKVGGCLPPLFGSYRPDQFRSDEAASMYPRIVNSLEPYIDLWLGETISCLDEAQAMIEAVRGSDKPLWLSFSLTDDVDLAEPCLRSGESIESALELAIESKSDALLFNCSLPEVIGKALEKLGPLRDRLAPGLPIGGYGNTFTPRTSDAVANGKLSEMRDEVTPEHYARLVAGWEHSGATIVGGCCGIGPEHIAVLARQS